MSGLVAVGVTGVSAVSLSNFVPRIENLPSGCQSAYTRTIQGCQASDFNTSNRCSASCLNGLVEIQRAITSSCRGVDVPETSIIGVFLLGQGIPALCPNAVVTTVGISSSTTRAQSQPQTTTTQARASTTSSSSAAQSTSSSGIDVDTSVPTGSSTFATSITSLPTQADDPPTNVQPVTSSSRPSQTQGSQRSNGGGGSPFDFQVTGSASQLQRLSLFTVGSLLVTASLFAAIL